MRKKIKLLALLLAIVATFGIGTVNAFASATTKVVLDDSFNSLEFNGTVDSNKWATTVADVENPSIKQAGASNACLQFLQNKSGGEEVQLGTKDKITNIEYVSFSLRFPSTSAGKWIMVSFVPNLVGATGSNVYDGTILINDHNIQSRKTNRNVSFAGLFPNGDYSDAWISFKLVPASQTQIDVYVAPRNEDGTVNFPDTPNATFDGFYGEPTAEQSYKDAYILFGSEGRGNGVMIDDIEIKGDKTVIENYTSVERSEDIVSYGKAMGYSFKVLDDSKLEFTATKAGDRVISTTPIQEETSIAETVIVLDITFNVKMAKGSTDEIAFVFGVPSTSADPRENGYAYVIGENSASVIKYANGEIAEEQKDVHLLTQVTSKKGAEIRIAVTKTGVVEVYENGYKLDEIVEADTYIGHVGFMAVKDNQSTVQVDNVILRNTTYFVPVTKSVTHNFSNNFFGNAGHKDFHVTNGGAGVIKAENGKLVFEGCVDDSYFGSAHQYDSFIMDYQLCNIYVGTDAMEERERTAPERWFGLDIGRSSKNFTNYGNNAMLYFTITPTATTSAFNLYTSANSTLDKTKVSITKHRDIPASLFKSIQYDGVTVQEYDVKQSDAVCVRWVSEAETETLKLYLKKASESAYTLYYEVKGINPSGYQVLCCTGYTYVKLDNFSMSNTSAIYEVADNEAPETITEIKTEVIYDKGHVDVNWNDELVLNGFGANTNTTAKVNGATVIMTAGGEDVKGCGSSMMGGLFALPVLGVAVAFIRRKR